MGGPDHLLLLEIYNEHFKKERSKTLSKIILGSFETPKSFFYLLNNVDYRSLLWADDQAYGIIWLRKLFIVCNIFIVEFFFN